MCSRRSQCVRLVISLPLTSFDEKQNDPRSTRAFDLLGTLAVIIITKTTCVKQNPAITPCSRHLKVRHWEPSTWNKYPTVLLLD